MRGEWIRRGGRIAVVFVHGVLSAGETCWLAPNGAFWPRLVAEDPVMDSVGVYLYSYRTGFFTGTYRLGDVVDDLKERMHLDGVDRCRTIVFVAHSMGGIVVRKLVVERADDFRQVNLGLFLVASPSLGSTYAETLAPLARILGHTQADALRFSQTNAWLMDLDREFKNLKARGTLQLAGKELVEDRFIVLRWLLRRQVVEPFSAAAYFGEAYKVPGSDHFTIAKPEGPDAIQHRLLIDFVTKVAAKSRPELDGELRRRLERRLAACRDAGLAFRAYHKLDAVFSMPTDFANRCLDESVAGASGQVGKWLRQAVRTQAVVEGDREGAPGGLDEDVHVAAAASIAEDDDARSTDERHLLLALLADSASATVAELRRFLGADGFDGFIAKVRSSRPSAGGLDCTPIAGRLGED
jgi:pimeloyl-ACP methyl ester carboxylesterase